MAMQAEREAMQAEWKKERRDMEKLRGELQTQVAIGDCGVLVHACHIWWRHIHSWTTPGGGHYKHWTRDPRTQILEGCVGL